MLVRSGENMLPGQIEEYRFQHPKLGQAGGNGVPDPKRGEAICDWIELREAEHATEEQICAFRRDQGDRFRISRNIFLVGEFPATITGKVQNFEMSEQMSEEFGLETSP